MSSPSSVSSAQALPLRCVMAAAVTEARHRLPPSRAPRYKTSPRTTAVLENESGSKRELRCGVPRGAARKTPAVGYTKPDTLTKPTHTHTHTPVRSGGGGGVALMVVVVVGVSELTEDEANQAFHDRTRAMAGWMRRVPPTG